MIQTSLLLLRITTRLLHGTTLICRPPTATGHQCRYTSLPRISSYTWTNYSKQYRVNKLSSSPHSQKFKFIIQHHHSDIACRRSHRPAAAGQLLESPCVLARGRMTDKIQSADKSRFPPTGIADIGRRKMILPKYA
eukprot:TRINITY_DN27062_c0_g1_i1.p1 TRINITY_DN27062_c0_g1~~TRINITY_DN27062_c0_g1_i1.p1  ORF type:complete len:136 (+),score=8.05 TRINITY_DN27062_c0_g1_i1:144-551(+)